MPTVFRHGPYRFFFYAGDKTEPPHVHVERDQATAKLWLNPIRLHSSRGFRRLELREIEGITEKNHRMLIGAWNDYFGQ